MKRKKIFVVLLLFLLVGCVKKESDLISVEEFAKIEGLETRLKREYQPNRDSYGYGVVGGNRFLIKDVLKELPALPDDFWYFKWKIMTGIMDTATMREINESHYEQPEFIANTFVDICIPLNYVNPDLEHWAPEGYGTFPHQTEVQTVAGETFEIYTFFHTSCGVERYQGLGLYVVYPTTVVLRDGTTSFVQSYDAERYITVDVTPKNLLTSPTYPIYKRGWNQKVKLTVTVAENTPKGIYAIGFDTTNADKQLEEQWIVQYKENYQSIGFVHLQEPQFIAAIVVQ